MQDVINYRRSFMWEELEIYKQLGKKDINPTFKKFGVAIISHVNGYSLAQTNSLIKLSRHVNQLEQAIFIEKAKGDYNIEVRTSIKPIDFYRQHKFTMLNIVTLGDILNNHRRTSISFNSRVGRTCNIPFGKNRIRNRKLFSSI
jgi:hypothetical protein